MPSGIGQGEPFILRDWQKEFICNVYDPVDENQLRVVRRALLSIARKNGKTALAAALVLVHLVGPESKYNGEVYSAASDRKQAGHIYKMARQMVELDDELKVWCYCIDTTKRIVCRRNGSFYESLAADARRQHGFNPHFVIYDELAQALNRDLYDVLDTSFGAQDEALFLSISTQSSDPQSIMSELADDAIAQERGDLNDPTFYGKVYAVPDDADPFDEDLWPLANPALADFRSLKDFRALANKARRSPSALARFRNLYLNQRVDGVEAFVSSVDWKACQGEVDAEALKGKPLYCGLDLSARQDLTAFSMAWDLGKRVVSKTYFWTPKHELAEREKRDGAKYVEWQKAGRLFVVEGRTVEYGAVLKGIVELIKGHDLQGLAYDRWRIDQIKREMTIAEIEPETWPLIEHGQGFKDMSPAIEAFENKVIDHDLVHDGNPVLTYCLSNVRVMRDPAGSRKFDKRQRHRRIDGAIALAMAISAMDKAEKPEKPAPSVYEKRGLLVV